MGLFILSILVEICLQVPLSGMSLCLLTPLSMSNLSVLKLSNLVSLLSIWLQFLVLMLDMHDTHDMPFSKYIKIGFLINIYQDFKKIELINITFILFDLFSVICLNQLIYIFY